MYKIVLNGIGSHTHRTPFKLNLGKKNSQNSYFDLKDSKTTVVNSVVPLELLFFVNNIGKRIVTQSHTHFIYYIFVCVCALYCYEQGGA